MLELMKNKERIIFEYVKKNNKVTIKEAVRLIGSDYFINGCKHPGGILSRMVKSGLLRRIKKGTFELDNNLKT